VCSYVDKGSNATSCVQAALQERQSQRREQAVWAAPNTLLLSPLRAATGANSGLGERALGVLALLPVVGWAGRGLGLAADVARGLSAASDVAATAANAESSITSLGTAIDEATGAGGSDSSEIFYRAMSNKEFANLSQTGELAPRGESFVTQSLDYV